MPSKSQQIVNTWISDIRARQKAGRNVVIIRLSRLGWAQEQIAEVVGVSRGRITQIINNTNFGKINNLFSRCRDMSYIAGHYQMDLALARALRLEGKTDHEKFKKKDYRGKANDKTPSISSYPREDYEGFFERKMKVRPLPFLITTESSLKQDGK